MKIGFVGLGNMGLPMARNLVEAGHEVRGYDAHPMRMDCAWLVHDLRTAVSGADLVITMLPSGPVLREVAGEAIPLMAPGSVLLDCSTVDVASARAVAEQAEAAGLIALDAPVSGGTSGAAAGTLTFMVGGPEEGLKVAAQALDIMGGRTVHCGGPGAGQAAKICNNMILGITMAGTCEAIALADSLGLDRQALYDVVSTSSGQSWSMTTYCPAPGIGPDSPADHDYAPGFAAALMLKDLRLSQQAAGETGARTPMGTAATAIYEAFVEDEDQGGRDFSALLPRLAAARS
jgi:3-hydroxyisobutyrate dehydrogenase